MISNNERKVKNLKYLPPLFWAVVIFILSAIPGNDYPEAVFDYSFVAHFVEFFVLSVLVLRVLGKQPRNIYLTVIICLLYAFVDETHQLFVPYRDFSGIDLLVDFWAILMGIEVFSLIKFEKKEDNKLVLD